MGTHKFNLRLWFAVASFGSIAIICSFAAFWVSSFLTTSLLERESEVSQEFMESIVNVDGADMFTDDGQVPLHQNARLLDFAKHILGMPGMMRVNIHAKTHRVLWSTEKSIVGEVFTNNEELDEAFEGKRTTEIGTLPAISKAEHVALPGTGHFIEAYIPIRLDAGKGATIGVVELYKQPQSLENLINSANRVVWTGAAIGAAVLFSALYWVVQRGALLIDRQQKDMVQMEAFAAIGQMSSAVAHSLRNPMAAIRSSAELWRSTQKPEDREVPDEIIAEVDRMDGYVRDLLTYSRAEPYQRHPVDPAGIVATILSKQKQAVERKRIVISVNDLRTERQKVQGDDMLLEQALTSVVTNALEAMTDDGRLTVDLSLLPESEMLRIAVSDTGTGIPTELLHRVSESYFTTKVRGLGLGLVLARGIIERFGGRLQIASTSGVGTTVCVDLRVA